MLLIVVAQVKVAKGQATHVTFHNALVDHLDENDETMLLINASKIMCLHRVCSV